VGTIIIKVPRMLTVADCWSLGPLLAALYDGHQRLGLVAVGGLSRALFIGEKPGICWHGSCQVSNHGQPAGSQLWRSRS
jgi:hypothetical protein